LEDAQGHRVQAGCGVHYLAEDVERAVFALGDVVEALDRVEPGGFQRVHNTGAGRVGGDRGEEIGFVGAPVDAQAVHDVARERHCTSRGRGRRGWGCGGLCGGERRGHVHLAVAAAGAAEGVRGDGLARGRPRDLFLHRAKTHRAAATAVAFGAADVPEHAQAAAVGNVGGDGERVRVAHDKAHGRDGRFDLARVGVGRLEVGNAHRSERPARDGFGDVRAGVRGRPGVHLGGQGRQARKASGHGGVGRGEHCGL